MTPDIRERVLHLLKSYHPTVVASMTGLTIKEVKECAKAHSHQQAMPVVPDAVAAKFTQELRAEMFAMHEENVPELCKVFSAKHKIPLKEVRMYAQQNGWALIRPKQEAAKSRADWSTEELEMVLHLREQLNMSWQEIGARVGRTAHSIRFKYARIRAASAAFVDAASGIADDEYQEAYMDDEPLSEVLVEDEKPIVETVLVPEMEIVPEPSEFIPYQIFAEMSPMAELPDTAVYNFPDLSEAQDQWLRHTSDLIVKSAAGPSSNKELTTESLVAAAHKFRYDLSVQSFNTNREAAGFSEPLTYAQAKRLVWWSLLSNRSAMLVMERMIKDVNRHPSDNKWRRYSITHA